MNINNFQDTLDQEMNRLESKGIFDSIDLNNPENLLFWSKYAMSMKKPSSSSSSNVVSNQSASESTVQYINETMKQVIKHVQ